MPVKRKTYEYEAYVSGVLDGTIVTGSLMRKAVERFVALREIYEFREDRARLPIDFFDLLRHFEGKSAGKQFILEPWQQFVLAYIFGLHDHDGLRLVREVYLEMARKNGKTAFAAGIALYCLTLDGERGPEVDLAANSRDQASLAFKFCYNFSKGLDPKGRVLTPYQGKVKLVPSPGVLQVFASDTSKLDGYNASFYILDEFHAAKDTRLRDVLDSSQGARQQPLGMIITSAGFDKLGPCYKRRQMCTEVLSGLKEDDRLAAFIFSMDEGDDWTDSSVWVKSNPNLGVTVTKAFLAQQVKKAKNEPSSEVGVRTKNLNEWVDAETVWIPDHYILDSSRDVDLVDYEGCDAWVGLDLSSTTDLTALGVMIPGDDGKFTYKVRYYLPEESLKTNRAKELYGDWRRRGLITITPGNVTDYDYVLNDLMEWAGILNIQAVAYDSWNATQFTINATEKGLPMVPFSQALGNFNKPTKEFERLMLSGRVILDNNEINRYCFRNVVLARDRNGNVKPSKERQEQHIDGVIPILESTGVWLNSPRYGEFY